MASQQTDFRNSEAVLNQYDVMDTPYYTVFQGKDYKFDWMEEDLEGGRNHLKQQLEAIKFFGNTAQFKICFYRKLTEKGTFNIENIKGSNTFKVIAEEQADQSPYWAAKNNYVHPEIKALIEKIDAQQSQINALLQESDQEEEEEENKGVLGGLLNGLTPILQNPAIQQAIAGRIIGFLDKLVPDNKTKTMYMQPAGTLSGVSETEPSEQEEQIILNNALVKLFNNGVTVNDIQKLADMADNPVQFNFLLSMLRK